MQFLTYGDLHLPLGPSLIGPSPIYPLLALVTPARTPSDVGGNATQPPGAWSTPNVSAAKFRFSTRHPLLTWKISSPGLRGTTVTSLRS